MTQSRRCECLGRRHVEASAAEAPQQPPAVAEWRRRRGFGGAPSGAVHKCEGGTWSRVGVALLCDRCGFAHVRTRDGSEFPFVTLYFDVLAPGYDVSYGNYGQNRMFKTSSLSIDPCSWF